MMWETFVVMVVVVIILKPVLMAAEISTQKWTLIMILRTEFFLNEIHVSF